MRFLTSKKNVSANNEPLVKKMAETGKTFPDSVKVEGNKIEAIGVEYPQFDTLEEFVKSAGDEKAAVDYVNRHAENDAKNVVRTGIRTLAADADFSAKIKDFFAGARDWTPSARGVSVKAKAEALDSAKSALLKAQEEGRTLTTEELLAMLDAGR